ncbi:hypothetical protein SAMN02949497_1211 [Methylomagnum ishizawai]|uniref:Uncharacterized protein n=1 Tax=Methylomagnum ishizawai TaxID=1760988 RepID=A0A1Y6D1Q2_9GAMM|nr:hypothetical protein [Methylomagnum ishizawai]SMF93915.1 hypothetical protein SAMN02949497_1211 [Methylomagnum ishizawai]
MGSTTKRIPLLIQQLNRAILAARDVQLGTLLNDIITQFNALRADVAALRTRMNTASLASAGLAIKTSSSAVVKYTGTISAIVAGVPIRKTAGDMPALAGTLATAKSAAWAFYIDESGTLSVSAKTADKTTHDLALAALPANPDNKALVGFVVIDNATGSNFVGGTTALDTASLTVTYYNAIGMTAFVAVLASADLAALNER